MNITLDPRDQKDLEALARESGMDPGQLLRELIHEAISGRKQNGASVLRRGSGRVPAELGVPPTGEGPSGVLDALLEERAQGR